MSDAATPEDQDGDGLTERPSVAWLLWVSDAITEFANGTIAGFGAGTVVGGTAAAGSDTMNAQALTITAAIAFVTTALANGLKHLVIYQHNHPMPNPFRARK